MRAEQLADAEKRPGGERPAARRDDPALVGAAREQRAHRERERDRQPDVAEIEHRRVGDHVRVLEARVESGAVGGGDLRLERARDRDEQQREERSDDSEHRYRPRDDLSRRVAVEQHGGGAIPVSTSNQSSSEPACPPQNADSV